MNSITLILIRLTACCLLVGRCLMVAHGTESSISSQPESRSSGETLEKVPPILVNHVGFTPTGAKYCLIAGNASQAFEVVEMATGQVVYEGRPYPGGTELGVWQIGDFSALKQTGTFQVRASNGQSEHFMIAPDVYDDALRKTVTYFAKQRCGPSETGYHAPCHLDDGRRRDNGQHQDVTGGWHDACDLRKWVDATIFGMIGLNRVAELYQPAWGQTSIRDELHWGNRYFLAMQEPAGYVMNYCGGNDGNRWTTNQVGDVDDRPIHTEPCNATAQFCFILSQAATARLTQTVDPTYGTKCREAALRCLAWCRTNNIGRTSTDLGAAVAACVELHRTFGEDQYRALAIEYARRLLALQVTESNDGDTPIRGFFRTSPTEAEPRRDISHGCWQLIGLCAALERFPDVPEAPTWQAAIRLYVEEYLTPLLSRSAFGIAPFGPYTKDPGGNRRIGDYWYRYFMEPSPRWWVGINANLASTGVGLAKAGKLLKEPRWVALAQRQLDWILGVNPFNASTMTGVGRHQPRQFVTGEFKPVTPLIDGAVMNGIGGTREDQPDLKPGSWQTCEYWTPMVCYTMWLMSELALGSSPSVSELFHQHLADYDAELRQADGRVAIDPLVKRLKELGVTTYYWLVWHAATDWEDLQRFLPKAAEAHINVWVYLVPPSESPPQYSTLYSEPFRLDYHRWAEEIARLSMQYTNLTAWVIDDFYANHQFFTPTYLRDMQAKAKRLNPKLAFLPLMYFNEITRSFVEAYHEVIDGVVVAYPPDGEEIRYARAILNDETLILPGQLSCPWNQPTQAGDFAKAELSMRVLSADRCRLIFREHDDFTGPTAGYHFKQLLVNGSVIWEQDVAGGTSEWGKVQVDLTPYVSGKTNLMIALQLLDKKGVSNFGVRWRLRDLQVEGLEPLANLNEPQQWQVAQQGPLEAGFGERIQAGKHRFHIPFIVMTAGDASEFRQRHGDPASPERIAEWLRMCLRAWQNGQCDGVVTYCLDKQPQSKTLPFAQQLFIEFKKGKP